MYKGIIFDFDGVLYDSEKHWAQIENPYLKKHIKVWRDTDYSLLIGKSINSAYDYLVKNFGFNLRREQYLADYEMMAIRLYSQLAQPLANIDLIASVLESYPEKIAIASSSKPDWIKLAIGHKPLPMQINTVVTAHDPGMNHGKPAPDIYLEASRRLGLESCDLIAIEDSETGIASAKAAGLYCIGLLNGFNAGQDLSQADEVFTGYTHETANRLNELLS